MSPQNIRIPLSCFNQLFCSHCFSHCLGPPTQHLYLHNTTTTIHNITTTTAIIIITTAKKCNITCAPYCTKDNQCPYLWKVWQWRLQLYVMSLSSISLLAIQLYKLKFLESCHRILGQSSTPERTYNIHKHNVPQTSPEIVLLVQNCRVTDGHFPRLLWFPLISHIQNT